MWRSESGSTWKQLSEAGGWETTWEAADFTPVSPGPESTGRTELASGQDTVAGGLWRSRWQDWERQVCGE